MNETVQRQFGSVAANYATSAVHAGGPDLAALVQAAALTGTERVLDLGCGAGHTALALAPGAAEVVAVDLTPEMVAVAGDIARQRGASNVTVRQADVADLPFPAASFDLVSSRYSAHHYADPARALAEAFRVLKPGGSFLLVDTVAPEDSALDTFLNAVEILRDPSHVRDPRVSEWRRLLGEAGFTSAVAFEMLLDLDGASWVERMRTPSAQVAAIHALFAIATPAATECFALTLGEGWGWRIPVALLHARRPLQ